MTVKVITDSTCDLAPEIASAYALDVLPLKIIFEDGVYADGIGLSRKKFYTKLQASQTLPKTAQVNPGEFTAAFCEALQDYDEVVMLTLSSELSGTYSAALSAREQLAAKERVFVVDSRFASLGLGLLAIEMADLAKQGLTGAQIAADLTDCIARTRLYATIGNLDNLKKGGRLSSTGAFVGNILGIRPLIALEDGKIVMIGMTRGKKKAIATLFQQMEEDGLDVSQARIALAHGDCPKDMAEMKKALLTRGADLQRILEVEVGAVIGTHTGAGIFGISYILPPKATER